jgi:hypothetical protein
VPTIPSASFLRESLIKTQKFDGRGTVLSTSNFELQRNMRSSFLKNWLDARKKSLAESSHNVDFSIMDCVNTNPYIRIKTIKRRWDKEEKRRKDHIEKKKRTVSDYQRALLEHRENFLKFHRFKSGGKFWTNYVS